MCGKGSEFGWVHIFSHKLLYSSIVHNYNPLGLAIFFLKGIGRSLTLSLSLDRTQYYQPIYISAELSVLCDKRFSNQASVEEVVRDGGRGGGGQIEW